MSSDNFPEELTDKVANLHGSLTEVKTKLEVLVNHPKEQLYEKLDPMGRAKLDLVSAYAVNSLFWMLLRTQGENPQATDVKNELDRVKAAMMRCKEIQDKAKRAKVDQKAAKRMVASGLWNPGEAKHKGQDGTEEENQSGVPSRPVPLGGQEGGEYDPPKKKIRQFDV